MNKSPKSLTGNNLGIKHNLLMSKLKLFYGEKKNMDELLPIINGNTKLSLRIIDWFVTNYCKKHNITYYIDNHNEINSSGEQFIVYLRYKMQLKSFLKKQFDPFCRRERIKFFYNDNYIITTVGQLNFFKWAIEKNVIQYIKDNLKDIELDMNTNIRKNYSKKSKKNELRKKRKELSSCATRTINKHSHKITLSFD